MMKNLVRTAISEVCYLRGLFPQDSFMETHLDTTKVRLLTSRALDDKGKPTGDVKNKDVEALLTTLESAFQALEQGFLRGLGA